MSAKRKTRIRQRKPASPEAAGDTFFAIVPTGLSSIEFIPQEFHAPKLEVVLTLQGGGEATATIEVDGGVKKPLQPNVSQQFQVSQQLNIDATVTQGLAKLSVSYVS